ncbi:MAG TPA: hypothetical protein VN437_01935 [Rectinemataceae bacterium]|nr:hypothetical protein [Rectinemataceae bacterium]
MLIPALLALALVLYGLEPTSRNARLYFLDSTRSKLIEENRELALMGSIEERSRNVLGELMLGPFGHSLQPLFNKDAQLRAVMHRGSRLYVAIEMPDIFSLNTPFGLIENAFERTLADSVPGAGSLELFVNGNLVSR